MDMGLVHGEEIIVRTRLADVAFLQHVDEIGLAHGGQAMTYDQRRTIPDERLEIPEQLELDGDGRHFQALIVSEEFAGKSRVQRQQRVHEALKAQLDTGELHAISFKTLTPAEWSAQRG